MRFFSSDGVVAQVSLVLDGGATPLMQPAEIPVLNRAPTALHRGVISNPAPMRPFDFFRLTVSFLFFRTKSADSVPVLRGAAIEVRNCSSSRRNHGRTESNLRVAEGC